MLAQRSPAVTHSCGQTGFCPSQDCIDVRNQNIKDCATLHYVQGLGGFFLWAEWDKKAVLTGRFISTPSTPPEVFVCGCLCSQRGQKLSHWLINLPGILKPSELWNTHVGLYAAVPEVSVKPAEILSAAVGDCAAEGVSSTDPQCPSVQIIVVWQIFYSLTFECWQF